MHTHPMQRRRQAPRGRQEGAVLYVALVMLVLLAMIGVVGMQVATLQERMSANYLTTNVAFQRAEGQLRTKEGAIDVSTKANGWYSVDSIDCTDGFAPTNWASTQTATTAPYAVYTRMVTQCVPGNKLNVGGVINEAVDQMYQITAFSRDQDATADSSSVSAVDSYYIP